MKWLYLPWHYRSADNATKVSNFILYVVGVLLVFAIGTFGYRMIHIHFVGQQETYLTTHRQSKEVPHIIDRRDHHYVYHTNLRKYQNVQRTIQDTVRVASQHDLSSDTNRIYWMKNYLSNDELNDSNFPLAHHPIDSKSVWIGFNDGTKDNRNVQFIVRGKNYDRDDLDDNDQSYPVIMTGSFDTKTQKITKLGSVNNQ